MMKPPFRQLQQQQQRHQHGNGALSWWKYRWVIFPVIVATMTSSEAALAATKCPKGCVCRDADVLTSGNVVGSLIVDCRGRMAESIETLKTIPTDVGELDLGENKMMLGPTSSTNGIVVRNWFPVLARLRRLKIDQCALRRIERQAFRNIRTSVELIDLSNNEIEFVHQNAFRELIALRILILSSNRLGIDTSGPLSDYTFRGLSLGALDLASNSLSFLPDLLFDGVTRVDSLRLDDNRLAVVNNTIFRPLHNTLRNLTIVGNRVPLTVTHDAYNGFSFTLLDISKSGISDVRFLEEIDAVELLNLGRNPLGGEFTLQWYSSLKGNCRSVFLDDVGFTELSSTFLSMFRSIEHLDLSNNRLTSVDPEIFRGQVQSLRRLNLANNSISGQSTIGDLVLQMRSLALLNLSGNLLTDIRFPSLSAASSTKLSVLDLSRNRIQVLPPVVRSVFDQVADVRLAGNPIHCNCESIWLLQWTKDRLGQSSTTTDSDDYASNLREIRCASPESFASRFLYTVDSTSLVCRPPKIVSLSPSISVVENTTLVLTCIAEGDPAPAISWSSRNRYISGVTPSSDRTNYRTMAHWSQRLSLRVHSGWYACNATSTGAVSGFDVGYTYIDVTAPGETSAVDLASLTYPNLPLSPGSISTEDNLVSSVPPFSSSSSSSSSTAAAAVEKPISTRSPLVPVSAKTEPSTRAADALTSVASSSGILLELTSTISSFSNWTVVVPTPGTAAAQETSTTLPIAKPSVGWHTTEIIGLAVGLGLAFVVLIALIVGVLCFVRHRERRQAEKHRHSILGDVPASPVFSAYIRSGSRTGPSSFKPGISLASGNSPPGTDVDPDVPRFTFQGAVEDRAVVAGRTTAESSTLVRRPMDSESIDSRTEGPGERDELLSFRPTATTLNGNRTPAV